MAYSITTRTGRTLGLVIVVSLCVLACSVLEQQHSDPVTVAKDSIPIGTSRTKALDALSDAQRHIACWYPSGEVDDLFFYGAYEPEEATVVIISSEVVEGQLQVYAIGTFEYYALRTEYGDCIERDTQSISP